MQQLQTRSRTWSPLRLPRRRRSHETRLHMAPAAGPRPLVQLTLRRIYKDFATPLFYRPGPHVTKKRINCRLRGRGRCWWAAPAAREPEQQRAWQVAVGDGRLRGSPSRGGRGRWWWVTASCAGAQTAAAGGTVGARGGRPAGGSSWLEPGVGRRSSWP